MTNSHALASVKGGQLYTSTTVTSVFHTFLIKYNAEGVVQWANYVNCPSSAEDNNTGICVTTQSNGNIIVFGILPGEPVNTRSAEFFAPSDFINPVKILTNDLYNGRYLACLSPQGLPLWVNKLTTGAYPSRLTLCSALNVDLFDNIYGVGYVGEVNLFQPTGQLVYSDPNTSIGKLMLVKYYPNGFVQSYTACAADVEVLSASLRVLGSGDVYFSGWCTDAGTLTAYTSDYNIPSVPLNFATAGSFSGRYSSLTTPWITFPEPGYNTVFQPEFAIGGSTRNFIDGYAGDGSIEIWGGKTGLSPSTVNIADLNASVISYLGHQPGYTIPVEDGVQTLNPSIYNHLTVGISEPSFPNMDPQPVTPGTIPYGFLPIFVNFPSYTTGLIMNNSNNNQTNAILSATGIVSSDNLFALGVSAGDKVRILLNTTISTQYLTFTVVGFIGSDVVGNIQTGIVFEESTRYVSSVLGTTVNATATLIIVGSDRYASMFWQPIIVEDGTLNLIVQLYPQFTN